MKATETTDSSKNKSLTNAPYTPVLVVAVVIASFFLGMLTTKVQYLEKQGATNTTATTTTQTPDTPTAPSVTQEQIKALFNDTSISFGDKNSKTLIVEVADPSCPWCHVAAGNNPELAKEVGKTLDTDGGTYVAPVPQIEKLVESGKAAFVWIYTNGHGNGEMGTKALYCAHEKGDFWPAHNKLMTNEGYNLLNNSVKNDKTKSQELADFLASVTNATDLKTCLDNGKYDDKISEDVAIAGSIGISGTPGFYINTTNFPGAYAWDEMKSAIEE